MLLVFLNQVVVINLWAQTIITARVSNVSGSQIVINQGSNSGLEVDAEGVVYYMQPVADRSVRVAVALVRVTSVTSTTARLVIEDSTAEVMSGYLVDLSVTPLPQPEAKKKGSKWWIWLIVAAAGGGIAAAAGGGGGGGGGATPPPTTGTISIDLPAH